MRQLGPLANEAQVRAEMERQRRRQDDLEQADVVVEHPRRLFLRSPNGTYWKLVVADDGSLSTTNAGTTL